MLLMKRVFINMIYLLMLLMKRVFINMALTILHKSIHREIMLLLIGGKLVKGDF